MVRHDRDINAQHGQRDKQQQAAAVAAMSKRARRHGMGENLWHGMRIISPASSWRSLRCARGLAGSTLTLRGLSGKLGLPPQSNIVVITAVCLKVSGCSGMPRKSGGAHTHGIGITLRTGSSRSRGVTCWHSLLLGNTVVVRRLTIVGVIIIAMLAATRRGTARALLLLSSVLVSCCK